jgi:predicted lipoprotein
MNKYLKYFLLIVAVGLVAYESVYIKKLSTMVKTTADKFDAVSFSKKLWEERLPAKLDSAIELSGFIKAVQQDPDNALLRHSNALGIGNYRYAMIKTNGVVTELGDDDNTLQINTGDSMMTVKLATEFIYGNALRDASALVKVKDFPNTMDLNNISEELNKSVRETVLPPYREKVKKGDKINVTGAIEINRAHLRWSGLEIIPVRLEFLQ